MTDLRCDAGGPAVPRLPSTTRNHGGVKYSQAKRYCNSYAPMSQAPKPGRGKPR